MPVGTETRLARRAAILAAARRLLAARGFEGVTMRGLAREAQVSVPTLYNTFANKDAVLAEAIEELVRAQLSAVRGARERGLGRILRTAEMPLGIIESMPDYSIAVMKYFDRRQSPARRQVEAAAYTALVVGVRELVEDGLIRPEVPPDALATAIYVALEGAIRGWELGWFTIDACRRSTMLAVYLALLGLAAGDLRAEIDGRIRALAAPEQPWLSAALRSPAR